MSDMSRRAAACSMPSRRHDLFYPPSALAQGERAMTDGEIVTFSTTVHFSQKQGGSRRPGGGRRDDVKAVPRFQSITQHHRRFSAAS